MSYGIEYALWDRVCFMGLSTIHEINKIHQISIFENNMITIETKKFRLVLIYI